VAQSVNGVRWLEEAKNTRNLDDEPIFNLLFNVCRNSDAHYESAIVLVPKCLSFLQSLLIVTLLVLQTYSKILLKKQDISRRGRETPPTGL
jgi:hypothetical protein